MAINIQKKICIIVPAYNEEGFLAEVVGDIRKYCPEAQIVVVNDASSDSTKLVAWSQRVPVLDLPTNLGIGGAMQTGFLYAVRNGFDVAMQVDADGQHDPRFIPVLLEALGERGADMVIGSRFLERVGYRASFMRLFGIRFFAWLIGMMTNRRVYDATSGYRAYNKEALNFVAKYYPSDFPEPESIVIMLRNGFKIKEVPVVMKHRQAGTSSVRPLKGTYFVVSNAVAIIISAFKRRLRSSL
ncbi:MAG: glycosyltransferase family 2 protein [bacterium]|nr:glycosyltransferase family 2 protein [bacterium]MDZ4346712.1 glycosyltransferase family 2 protein [Candidatus Binatia bacterium]